MNSPRLAKVWLALEKDHSKAARLIASDAFLEEGREDIANALQWCAANDKWPMYAPENPWPCWWFTTEPGHFRDGNYLPLETYKLLKMGRFYEDRGYSTVREYQSQSESIADLGQALAKMQNELDATD